VGRGYSEACGDFDSARAMESTVLIKKKLRTLLYLLRTSPYNHCTIYYPCKNYCTSV